MKILIFCAVSILLLQCEICSGLKILGVVPVSSSSHFKVTGTLMRELARRGHEVTVISQFPQKKQISNYTDYTIQLPVQTFGINKLEYPFKNYQSYRMDFFGKTLGSDLCDLLSEPRIQEVLKTQPGHYDVIVLEILLSPCYLAFGQHLKAPIVGMVALKLPEWTKESFANPLNPSYMPSIFGIFSQKMTFWERLQNTIITNFLKYQINYHQHVQIKYVEEHFQRKILSVQELYDDVSLILVNTHHSLHGIHPTTPDIVEVGGLHVFADEQQLTPELKTWLDESTDGCILFTFGSMVKIETYPREVMEMFYETFERIAPVRVVIKIADVDELPPGLPKNVKPLPWLPQIAILKHKNVKLFITHGGLLGVQEAISHRVPMIGFPHIADQWTNLQSCVEKKIAIKLELDDTLNADTLTDAVTTVLTNPVYRENMERVSKLFLDRPMSALDTAVYWVEYTARNGKVLKSPATQLTWWQLYLLDVYGLLFVCFLVILYVIKRVVSFVFSFTFSRFVLEDISKSKKRK